MSRSRTRAGWAAVLGVALVLTACGSEGGTSSGGSDDVLLDKSDVSPLEPTSVSTADPRENSGTQHWTCADNDGILLDQGCTAIICASVAA